MQDAHWEHVTTTTTNETLPPNDLHETDYIYSTWQVYVLIYASYLAAPLSVMGSALILYVMLYNSKSRAVLLEKRSVYYRIMMGMSTLDLLTSLSVLVFGSWAVPREYQTNIVHNRVTFVTCAVSGFFLNMVFGPMVYSAVLALYFFCRIRFGKPDEWFARRMEPVAHVLAWSHPLVLGTLGVVYQAFEPLAVLPGFCWFDEHPDECTGDNSENVYAYKRCNDGDGAARYRGVSAAYMLGGLPVLIPVWTLIAVCMVMIIGKVRAVERRMQLYAGSGTEHARNYERTRQVAREALLYIGAFLLTFFPMAGTQIANRGILVFMFAFLCKTLTTMQGFFNAFIFFHKRYDALSQEGQPLYFIRRWTSRFERKTATRQPPNSDAATGDMLESGSVHREFATMQP